MQKLSAQYCWWLDLINLLPSPTRNRKGGRLIKLMMEAEKGMQYRPSCRELLSCELGESNFQLGGRFSRWTHAYVIKQITNDEPDHRSSQPMLSFWNEISILLSVYTIHPTQGDEIAILQSSFGQFCTNYKPGQKTEEFRPSCTKRQMIQQCCNQRRGPTLVLRGGPTLPRGGSPTLA
jgi:hypothetical protein